MNVEVIHKQINHDIAEYDTEKLILSTAFHFPDKRLQHHVFSILLKSLVIRITQNHTVKVSQANIISSVFHSVSGNLDETKHTQLKFNSQTDSCFKQSLK